MAIARILGVVGLTVVLTLAEVKVQEKIEVKWGVADSTAVVGRPFRLHIPSDAFTQTPLGYTIKINEGEGLPQWLEFDAKENTVQGIPTPKDVGQVDLEVRGKGPINEAATSFSLLVRDVPSHSQGSALKFKKSGPEFVRCKREEPETVATIILDVDMDSMPVAGRMGLLKKFLGHMELHEEMVKMVPVGKSSIHDSSALVSGTGDCTERKTPGTFISWPVGCGQVKEGHFPILQRLDDDSTSGHMAKVLECPIIGWHVTNSHIHAPKRKRRQAVATATAVMTPIAPTKTEDKEDDKTDDGGDKLTRTVIDMETPVIKPTATQPEMTKTDEPVMPPKKDEKVDDIKPTIVEPPVEETKPTPPIKPTKTSDTDEPTDVVPPVVDTCIPGRKPMAKNTLFKLFYQAGNIIDFTIPEDAFEDCEVGGTRGLMLSLFSNDMKPLPEGFFAQLDSDNQKLIGLPLDNDIGRHRMTLVGKKVSGEKTLVDKINVLLIIKGRKNVRKVNHELSVTIDFPFKQFKSSVINQTNLANKVGRVYGDADASNLVITTMEEGSVIYGWANKSAMSSGCPVDDIKNMVGKLVNKDGSLTQEAIDILDPFFLSGAAAAPSGACSNNPDFPTVKSLPRKRTADPPTTPKPPTTTTTTSSTATTTTTTTTEEEEDKEETTTAAPVVPRVDVKSTTMKPKGDTEPDASPATDKPKDDDEEDEKEDEDKVAKGSKGSDDDDDILITTVVPAVVIVVILLIALLIACCLYRKKRKGKMNVEEQNTFVNKGAPVIFPDELGDKPSDVHKPLLVEGGSPAPPEYHRGTSESPEPEVANNHRNLHNNVNNDDGIQELPERPYEPPAPPVTGSGASKPRPTQQQPFSQPPQILP